jgi:hypothetical protein
MAKLDFDNLPMMEVADLLLGSQLRQLPVQLDFMPNGTSGNTSLQAMEREVSLGVLGQRRAPVPRHATLLIRVERHKSVAVLECRSDSLPLLHSVFVLQ